MVGTPFNLGFLSPQPPGSLYPQASSYPAFPRPPPKSVPAKRADDDVQFVSSKPVKRRRIDEEAPPPLPLPPIPQVAEQSENSSAGAGAGAGHSGPFSPPQFASSDSLEESRHSTLPIQLHPHAWEMRDNQARQSQAQRPERWHPPTKHASRRPPDQDHQRERNVASQSESEPERRVSTGSCRTATAPRVISKWDSIRGCSVPLLENGFFPDSFWTAPTTRRRSSPALSPKQLPEPKFPVQVKTEASPDPAGFADCGTEPSRTAQEPERQPAPSFPITAFKSDKNTVLHDNQFATYSLESNIYSNTPQNQAVHLSPLPLAAAPVQNFTFGGEGYGIFPSHMSESRSPVQSMGSSSFTTSPFPALAKTAVPMIAHQTMVRNNLKPGNSDSRQLVAGISMSSTRADNQHKGPPGNCNNGTGASTKPPCRKCIEERLRKQADALAAGIIPSSRPSNGEGNPSSNSYQAPWPNSMSGPTSSPISTSFASSGAPSGAYGQFFPQQMFPSNSAQMQSQAFMGDLNIPHTMPAQGATSGIKSGQMHNTLQTPPTSESRAVPNRPLAIHRHMAARQAQMPPSSKHVIVDIADTCMSVFPFEEVAKRHKQSVQKIKDVFDAIIQIPLLRSPTDKRRAGKLGTGRVKEFNQARREVQAAGFVGEDRSKQPGLQQHQQGQSARQQQPSVWDVANFMGPSDVNFSFSAQPYEGPW